MDSDKPIAAMRAASRRLQGLKLEEAEDPYGDSGEEESKEESRDTDTEQDSEQDSDQFSREQAKALLKKLTKEMGSKKKAVKFASKYLGLHAYMCLEAAFSVNDRVAPNSADDKLQKTIVDTGCSIDMFHPKVRDGLSGQSYKLDKPIEILQGSGSVSTNQLVLAARTIRDSEKKNTFYVAVTPGLFCQAFAPDLCILSARIASKLGLSMNITAEHPTKGKVLRDSMTSWNNKASFELDNKGNGIPFFRDMGFTESKIKEMMLDPKYTMLDAFNGKRFNFGRSIARAKDGFVKKFLESCNNEPEGEKKDYLFAMLVSRLRAF